MKVDLVAVVVQRTETMPVVVVVDIQPVVVDNMVLITDQEIQMVGMEEEGVVPTTRVRIRTMRLVSTKAMVRW